MGLRWKIRLGILVGIGALSLHAAPAAAVPGEPDGAFSGDGVATADFGGSGETANSIAVTPDGRVVAVGSPDIGATPPDFGLALFDQAGNLDPSFSGDGKTTTDVGSPGGDVANAVAVDADGNFVVAGYTVVDADPVNGEWDLVVARYEPDGTLDPSFSGDGVATTSVMEVDQIESVAIAPDGKIVVTGIAYDPSNPGVGDGPLIARFNPDGSPDSSFAGDGATVLSDGPAFGAQDVAVDSQGRIVFAGGATPGKPSVSRLTSAGSLDTSFSGDGTAIAEPLAESGLFWGVAVAPDDRIVAAGQINTDLVDPFAVDMAVGRFNTDGTLDTSFSGDGVHSVDLGGEDHAQNLALAPDGKVVLAGGTDTGSNPDNGAVLRLNANGTPDTTFSFDGTVLYNSGGFDVFLEAAIAPDGGILAGGTAAAGENPRNFVVARYEGDPVSLDTQIDSGPPAQTNQTAAQFGFSSPSPGVIGFECRIDSGPFAPCTSPHDLTNLIEGTHKFEIRSVNNIQSRDQTPAEHEWEVDTEVLVEIESKVIKLNKKGKGKVKVSCPSIEASGPCEGKLKVRTRKKLTVRVKRPASAAKRKRVVLAKKGFSIPAGETKKVRIKLSKKKLRLVRRNKKARKVQAIANVRDGAGNRAKVKKKLKLKLKRGSKKKS